MTDPARDIPQLHETEHGGEPSPAGGRVSVIIPCHNEGSAIGKVVRRFREVLPEAEILVVDNASSDDTWVVAREAGARVVSESRLGKGHALITGFELASDADHYVMVDGDDTYPASAVVELLAAARESGADMVVGTRLRTSATGAFPPGHTFGNRFFIFLVRLLFGIRTEDLFSGYRVLSRRYLRSSPLVAQGFEIEAELSVQAYEQGFQVVEMPVDYRARAGQSRSKLRTLHDGARILRGLVVFFRDYRPLSFFGSAAALLVVLSVLSGWAPVDDFIRTGLVHHLPRAVLAAGLGILAMLSIAIGVLLSSINRRSAELAALIRKRPR